MTLLFFILLIPQFLIASWSVRDTIILDGDTVYIEKRQRIVRLDSLQDAHSSDYLEKKIKQHRFSLGVQGALNQSVGSFQSAYETYTPLNNFMEKKKSVKNNFSPSLHLSYRIWETSLSQGELQLSLRTGLALNEVKINSLELNELEFARDSLIQLYYLDNQLQLEYFTIFDTTDQGIIGELDTVAIGVTEFTTRLRAVEIPFLIYLNYRLPNVKWAVEGGIGILYRRILSDGQALSDNYLVNSSADYRKFDRSFFHPQHGFTPVFSLGFAYHFIQNSLWEKHWALGLHITGSYPARALNPEDYFKMRHRSQSLALSICRTF